MSTTASTNQLISPRIAALASDLEGGNTSALGAFWQEVTQRGTPLVEPITGDDAHVLVTFLWRETAPLCNVVVISMFGNHTNLGGDQLAKFPDTDVWHNTYRL